MKKINGTEFSNLCFDPRKNPAFVETIDNITSARFKDCQLTSPALLKNYNYGFPIILDAGYYSKIRIEGENIQYLEIKDGTFSEGIEIAGGNFKHLKISGGVFKGPVTIAGGNFLTTFEISGGIFEKGLFLDGGNFSSKVIFKNSSFDQILFSEGNFNALVCLDQCKIEGYLSFASPTFLSGLLISAGQIHQITFEGGSYQLFVELKNIVCDILSIENGDFQIGINLTNLSIQQTYIEGGQLGNFTFFSGKYKEISFNGGEFQNIQFREGFYDFLEIKSLTVNDRVTLLGGEFLNIEFDTGFNSRNKFFLDDFGNKKLFVNRLEIFQIGSSHVIISGGEYNSIFFEESTSSKDCSIQISTIRAHEISFVQYNNHGYINFNGISSRTKPFVPSTSSTIQHVQYSIKKTGSTFRIFNSSLGKLEFIGCDLESFKNFELENSKILDVFIAGTKMPMEVSVTEDRDEDLIWLYEQQRLGYGQLKKICELKGDLFEAVQYHALQMDALYKSLNWKHHTFEKLTLWLNSTSNQHGRSWKQALLFTTVTSVFLFTGYCCSLVFYDGDIASQLSRYGDAQFFNIISHIFEFILPLHKSGFMEKAIDGLSLKENWISRIFDFSGRIFIAYGIYQLISAFRKHGKTSI